jgi:hypothetical protein
MGSCNSISGVTINLHQNNSFFFTDETVSGVVNWVNTKDDVRAKEIFIMFNGAIGYVTTRSVRDRNGHSNTVTDYHHVTVFSSKNSFALPQSGDEVLIFKQGQYSWPFEFSLTNHLPPTINSPQSYPHVRYYLQVVIDKPWYRTNTRELHYVTVYPRTSFLNNPQCLQQISFANQNRKKISLKGTINKAGFLPGEQIHFTIEIGNLREILIKHIDLSILQSSVIGRNQCHKNILQLTLSNIQNTKLQQIREAFFVTIPDILLAPSFEFQGGIQRTASIHIQYLVKLAVKVEGFFQNFDIDIPIIIATKSLISSEQDTQ